MTKEKEFKLLIFVGVSGSGKTTLTKRVIGEDRKVITVTTRSKRSGEKDGKDYIFLNKEEFKKRKLNGDFFETTKYAGNYYGTLKNNILKKEGVNYIITDYKGYKSFKKYYKDICTGVYINVDKDKIFESMISRGDNEEDAKKRIAGYVDEIKNKDKFELVFKNNFDEDSIKRFKELVNSL